MVTGVSASAIQNAHSLAAAPHTALPQWGRFDSTSSVGPLTGPAHWVLPPRPHVSGGTYTAESTNWSGQITGGTTFTGVSADWVVPTVQPTASLEASGTWIGIDGGPSSPSSIIQTGTAQVTEGGATGYDAWYELYPAPAVVLGSVSPGDQMQAVITQISGTNWTLSIADVTSGEQLIRTAHVHRSRPVRRMDRGTAQHRQPSSAVSRELRICAVHSFGFRCCRSEHGRHFARGHG